VSDLTLKQALELPRPLFVDVRSPAEFAEDRIPGAFNLPVLDDGERAETGTVYKQADPEEARSLGLRLITPKLPALMQELRRLSAEGDPVIYCWRGGLRSKSVQAVAELMNIPCHRLLGGYKEFRREVNAFFQQPCPFPVAVLHGLTGVGKTRILAELALIPGAQTLDLEGLAGNRGSVFGGVGLPAQPAQKSFESALWQAMRRFDRQKPLVVECESKRIGRLLLPPALHQAMQNGRHILVYDGMAGRVARVLEDYRPEERKEEILAALNRLREKLGNNVVEMLIKEIKAGNFNYVVEVLLTEYYDPLYKYPSRASQDFDFCLKHDGTRQVAREIFEYLS